MLKKQIRLVLFLSSYTPLFLIFAIQNPFKNWILTSGFCLLGLLSTLILFLLIRVGKNLEPEQLKIVQVNYRDGEAMSYIVTYLIPFLGIDFSSSKNWISLVIIFIILAVLYINSNLIYTNPMLNLNGFHIFEIQKENGNFILITKSEQISLNSFIKVVHLDSNVYLEVN